MYTDIVGTDNGGQSSIPLSVHVQQFRWESLFRLESIFPMTQDTQIMEKKNDKVECTKSSIFYLSEDIMKKK